MSLRDILLAVQHLSILGLFIECWIVFRRMKKPLHFFLLFSCFAALLQNLGYLLQLKSETEESYITALKTSYLGREWYAFFMLLFIAELTAVKIPDFVKKFMMMLQASIYVVILFLQDNRLYYTEYQFSKENIFPILHHENGIVHHLNMAVQVIYITIGLVWLLKAYFKEKNKLSRRRLFTMIISVVVQGTFFIVQISGMSPYKKFYDVTELGYFFGTLIMFIAIFYFKLLGTKEMAREYMIDRISEGVIAVDNEGIIQYFNEPAARLYPGLRQITGNLDKQSDEGAYDKELSPAEVLNAISSAEADGRSLTINEKIYTPEKTDLVYGGESVGKLYSLVDETEHLQYMEELEKQKEIADSANAAKSRFLANMSHEIRTPINAVLGMDEMILRESKEKSIRSYASDIMSAGRTLLSLINDILDLSKVEEGKMEIIPVQYELSSLINDLVNMIRDRAAGKALKLNVIVNEHIPHLLIGDEIRLRQCVMNLLTNAVKYTEKGSVTLRVDFKDAEDETVQTDSDDNEKADINHEEACGHIFLDFSVEDTGIGMKQEDMENLLSPYKRIEEKRNRYIEGTGLGMSITNELLELMGSKLKVKSEYGEGSVLSFSVKQGVVSFDEIGDYSDRLNKLANADEQYHELLKAPDARILVVDDTEMNLTVIKSLLKKTGIRIDTAASGADAITLATSNKYDAIFVDHMMQEMDGIETLKNIRGLDKNMDTPAVALTANAVSGAREMYLEAGFTDYLSKPVDGRKLEQMLCELLPEEKLQKTEDRQETINEGREFHKSRILVIDDEESNCALVKSILEDVYDIDICLSGQEAIDMVNDLIPDLVMLDIHLGDSNGFEVMNELKKDSQTKDIPVLMITGDNDVSSEENGLKSGASDYIRKPFVPDVLKQRVKHIVNLYHYQQSIEEEVKRQTIRSKTLTREMMLALSKTVDTKDHYTDGHSRRVGAISAEIGRRLGKSDSDQLKLFEIGLLHDIGKIGIHEDIITKDRKLSEDEYAEIKAHTIKGDEILREIRNMPKLREGARWHHEKFDGTGYPDGLKGEEIPEFARIVSVADCYDAMTSRRTYSEPRKQDDVKAEIERSKGTCFDPEIADVLIQMISEDTEYKMNEKAKPGDVWKGYDRLWGVSDVSEFDEDDIDVSFSDGNESDSETADSYEESYELPQWLNDITDLDTDAGLSYCGSAEGYMSVITVFHQTAAEKIAEIERFRNESDIESYTVKVHALKSSARIIGAKELSLLAEELENAGKKGNIEFINNNTGKVLSMYRDIDESFSKLDIRENTLPDIDERALKEAYQTIIEIAQTMDYGLMDEMIKNIRGYNLLDNEEKTVSSIEGMLNSLDWDGIIHTAEDALKLM